MQEEHILTPFYLGVRVCVRVCVSMCVCVNKLHSLWFCHMVGCDQ